ncbi:hypothetical protein AB0J82_00780 [Asanoa sp. NPDC049518]|uniref:hypothetical protein n=1 Tax=unclassified Asanoa TaxID=2685164 RepID=UPI0034475C94
MTYDSAARRGDPPASTTRGADMFDGAARMATDHGPARRDLRLRVRRPGPEEP